MGVLGAYCEDHQFQNGTPPIVQTSSGFFRAGFARCALSATNLGGGNAVKSNQFVGGAVTSAWLTVQLWVLNLNASNNCYCGFGQFSSQKGLMVGCSTAGGKAALFKYDGTTYTELASESGTSLLSEVLQKIDMQVINYGISATVNVYVAGVLIITFTGDVTVSGMTAMDCIISGPVIYGDPTWFSEVIASTDDTRAFSLLTQYGTGLGDTHLWTGAYTDCNPVTINDGNSVYTNTAGQDEMFDMNALPAGTFTIKACVVAARASKSAGASIGTLKLGWKTNGSVSVDGGHSLTTAWECYENLQIDNPVTSNAWQPSEINALQEDLQSAT